MHTAHPVVVPLDPTRLAALRAAGVDHPRIIGVAPGADEAPVTERGTQTLAAHQHQATDLTHGLGQVVVERRPPGLLGGEERPEAVLHPRRDHAERGGNGRGHDGQARG